MKKYKEQTTAMNRGNVEIRRGNTKRSIVYAVIIMLTIILFCSFFLLMKDSQPWYLHKMNISNSIKQNGEGVTIAIVDSGIAEEYLKQEKGSIIYPYNFVNNSTNVVDKKNGHGTELISVISGDKENKIKGLASKSKIMPIVVSDEFGNAKPGNLAKGIKWAVDHGSNIINISLGSNVRSDQVEDMIKYATQKNVKIVASAGDYSQRELLFPSSLANVLAISSQNKGGELSDFSNYSADKSILIPGEDIQVLSLDENGKFIKKSAWGTSISCALMSGVIALILQENPTISYTDLNESIKNVMSNKGKDFLNVQKLLENNKP